MRLSGERPFPLRRGLTVLAGAGLLAGCGALGGGSSSADLARVAALPANGPQADYPVLVGDAYRVAGETFTPSDTLNYDETGYLAAEHTGEGITGAHHTLPIPSYAEVTSLETGRTILLRLERRGPMDSTHIVELSPAAMAQLQAEPETPVRVRRVNPPEEHRAALRAGGSAPLRMDTPMSLVSVLRRQLPIPSAPAPIAAPPIAPAPMATADPAAVELGQAASAAPAPVPAPASVTPEPEEHAQTDALPALVPFEPAEETGDSFADAFADEAEPIVVDRDPAPRVATAPPVEPPIAQPAKAGFLVQAAAFSTDDRARTAANALGGVVTKAGRYFRVRTGPFTSRSEAEASLAIVKAAGYTDARILTSG